MLRPYKLLLIVLSTVFVVGCETDIDVIAPTRDLTVVYGLLEANKTRHYIRINRLFVGEQAAAVLAAQPGINEYEDSEIQAKIVELDDNEIPTGAEWALQPTYIYSKEEGAFNNDSNKVYYFDANLNPSLFYKLECNISIAGEAPKVVTSITNVLGNRSSSGSLEEIRLSKPKLSASNSSNGGTDRTNDEVTWVNNDDYAPSYEVQWGGTQGGALYTTYVRLYYRDIDPSDGTLLNKDSVSLAIGTRSADPKSFGTVTFNTSTRDIYATIGQRVPDHDIVTEDFRRIVSDTVQFFLEIANEELSTYIEINQPVTGVLQDRPEYTNIDNGIGIFASRFITSTRRDDEYESGRILDNRTLEELLYSNIPETGSYTVSKGFTNRRCTVTSTGETCQ